MPPVKLRFRYTEQDFVRAMRTDYANRLRLPLDIAVTVVGLALGTYLWLSSESWIGLVALAVSGLFGLLLLAAFFVIPRVIFRTQSKFRGEYELTFSTDGIHFRTAHIDSRLEWSMYTHALVDANSYLLYYGARTFTVIPIRVLENQPERILFDQMIEQKISKIVMKGKAKTLSGAAGRVVILALVALLCTGLLPVRLLAVAQAEQPIEHVILVSVDGLMPATYLEPDAHNLKVPLLREMVRRGAHSDGLTSVFPTLTYPAHTSLATGVNPGTHGITTNLALDPLQQNHQGWRWYAEDIRVPTLWDAAHAAGLRTALVWWPVTVGARAQVLVPEMWRAHVPEDVKLVRALSTPGLLADVERRFPRLLEGMVPPEVDDESATDIAVHVLETARPNLMLVHLLEVDRYQHRDGPLRGRAAAAVEKADRMLTRLIEAARKAGIWEKTALVVVSDHGFASYQRTVRAGALLRRHGWITVNEKDEVQDWKAHVVAGGGHAYVYLRDPKDAGARRALWDIFAPLAGKPGSGIGKAYAAEELNRLGGDPGAALALEAAPGFAMANGYPAEVFGTSSDVATHGFDPARDDMQAALLIYGPPIAAQKLPRARVIDIAPTIAAWLRLELKTAEGKPLPVRMAAPGAGGSQ